MATKTDQCCNYTFPCARRREERIKVCTRRRNTRVVAMMGGGGAAYIQDLSIAWLYGTTASRVSFRQKEEKGTQGEFASVVDPFICLAFKKSKYKCKHIKGVYFCAYQVLTILFILFDFISCIRKLKHKIKTFKSTQPNRKFFLQKFAPGKQKNLATTYIGKISDIFQLIRRVNEEKVSI